MPPGNGDVYDNGPTNGTTDAWTINFGFVVSDSFTVSANNVSGMTFAAWVTPGDVLQSAEVQIGTSPFRNDLFDQTINFTQSGCFSNQYGFNVCNESGNFNVILNGGGPYWVTLQNASSSLADPIYWDENSGPSSAENNMVGTIPSESFTLLGGGGGTGGCFHPGGRLQVLYNFTPQQSGTYPGPSGVVMDQAGNLYGTTYNGGDNSAGFAYKLSHLGGWLLDPLFSFFGGDSGGEPSGAIIGSNGSLYGSATGGIQNCGSDGSQYCGLVYNLTPPPTACATALCGWIESVPYRFNSESDGSGVINVSAHDQQGNLYGTTSTGGAYGAGTVFELTPSGLSWTKTTLYGFTGGRDGTTPTQVVVGNDGNLYGIAGGGAFRGGVVFQLTPSDGQWTESVIHIFGFNGSSSNPNNLVQDSTGNLYGTAIMAPVNGPEAAALFVLQKTASGWNYNEHVVAHECTPSDFLYETLDKLTIDAAGNLYGTGGASDNFSRNSGRRSPGGELCFFNYAFKASYDNNGWHYQDLEFLLNTYFGSSGSLALDASGNLYGTTYNCGTNNSGTVWQLSP
jgi:uncharacterized repeat protein (TIGR03803 family)